MRKIVILITLMIILTMVGCGDEEVWEPIEDADKLESINAFLYEYHEVWSESLTSSFSLMENFFVPNSHVYHMQRRQHQQIVSERKVENLITVEDIHLESNEHGEFRLSWTEIFEVVNGESSEEEMRRRSYYISERNNSFIITKIERVDI